MRFFLPVVLALSVLIWGAVPSPLAAQTAEEDRGYLQSLLEDQLSQAGREVRITGFSGALSSRASVTAITIADADGIWLTLKGVVLDWNRSALLRGAIEIRELTADEIILERAPAVAQDKTKPEATGFALPDLPVSVDIGTIAAERVLLGAALFGQKAEVKLQGTANLSNGEGSASLEISRLDRTSDGLRFSAEFSNESEVLTLALNLSEEENGIASNLLDLPGRPALDLSVEGTGPLSDFTADIALTTDGEERLRGNVTLEGVVPDADSADATPLRFSADIGGDIAPLFLPAYRDFFGRSIRLTVSGERAPDGALDLETFQLTTAALFLGGKLELGADGWPQRFDLNGQIANADASPVLLPIGGAPTTLGGADLNLTYDRAEGDGFSGAIRLRNLVRAGFALAGAELSTDGTLLQGDGLPVGEAKGALRLRLTGIAPEDQALARAIGQTLAGDVTFEWLQGTPLQLPSFSLSGADYGLTGKGSIEGFQDGFDLLARGAATLTAPDLSRFGDLAGLPLTGGATVQIAGKVAPLGGIFDLTIDGTAADIAIGQPQLDPLIQGEGALSIAIRRDTTGTILERLALTTPATALTASANLRTGATSGRVDLRLGDVALAFPGLNGPAYLGVSAQQNGDVWSVDASATGPGTATAAVVGDVTLEGATPRLFKGRVVFKAEDIRPYSVVAKRSLAGAADISLEGEANLVNKSFDLSTVFTGRDLRVGQEQVDRLLAGQSDAVIRVSRDLKGTLLVPSARLQTPQITIQASGEALPGDGNASTRFDLRLPDSRLIDPRLEGAATLIGTLVQTGDTWRIDAAATGPGRAAFDIEGDVTVEGAEPRRFDGKISANIETLAPYSGLAGRPLGGSADMRLEGRADLVARTFDLVANATAQDLRLGDTRIDGLLKGAGRADIRIRRGTDGAILVDRGEIVTPQLSLVASGEALPEAGNSKTIFELSLPNTGVVAPGLSGPASARGTLVQRGDVWSVETQASGPGDADITAIGDVTVSNMTPVAASGVVTLRAANITPYGALLGRRLTGAIDARVEGSADLVAGSFTADVRGDARNLALGIAQIDQLLVGQSRLEARVARSAAGLLSLSQGQFQSPQLQFTADSTLAANGSSRTDFNATLRDASLFVPGLEGPVTASGSAESFDGGFRISTTANGPGGSNANVAGTVSTAGIYDLRIAGAVPLALTDPLLAPRRLSGLAQVDLAINGPANVNSISGTIRTVNGRLVLPTFGIALGDLELAIQLQNGRAELSAASSVASGGRVVLAGPINLNPPFVADIALDLQEVGLSRSGLFDTKASGRVTLRGPLTGGARIAGTIDLDTVNIRIPDSGGPQREFVDGLRHINEPADVRRTRRYAGVTADETTGADGADARPFAIDVLVRAPARIFVRGRGLDAELGGRIQLGGTTAQIMPVGRFDLIRGRLDLLGKRIELTEGSATMLGDFEPTIRLVAETQAGEVTVRVVVEGPASKPEVRFESTPSLPEDEVLSQLFFGRGIGNISALQAVQLASAVATLSGRGGEGLVGKLRRNIGVDDLDVVTTEEGVTEARIGKYISEKAYTDVTVDSDGKSQINLNIQINPALTLRGSTDSEGNSGVGVYFEKNY